MVVLGVHTFGANFVPKFLRESTQKWLGPSGSPLCTKGSGKELRHLSVDIGKHTSKSVVGRIERLIMNVRKCNADGFVIWLLLILLPTLTFSVSAGSHAPSAFIVSTWNLTFSPFGSSSKGIGIAQLPPPCSFWICCTLWKRKREKKK